MPLFRAQKGQIKKLLAGDDWRSKLDEIAEGRLTAVGPLMSFLLYEPKARLRAAIALGRTTALIFKDNSETARDIVRRLNWRLSEESGNIGWGVPEAVSEILAQSPQLEREYYKPFFATILDLGFDDNYVDNDVLRRSCYFAIGRLIRQAPKHGEEVRALLRRGLADDDLACRGYAAWALGMLRPSLDDIFPLRDLAGSGADCVCELTDGDSVITATPCELAMDVIKNTPRIGV